MVTTLLFAGITSLILCFFASIAEEFLQPKKRKAFFMSAAKSHPSAPSAEEKQK